MRCIIPLISLCCYQHTCWTDSLIDVLSIALLSVNLMPFASKEDSFGSIQFEGISIQVDESIRK